MKKSSGTTYRFIAFEPTHPPELDEFESPAISTVIPLAYVPTDDGQRVTKVGCWVIRTVPAPKYNAWKLRERIEQALDENPSICDCDGDEKRVCVLHKALEGIEDAPKDG